MEPVLDTPVQITSSAIGEIKRLLMTSDHPFLRVGVKGGGCSGLTYVLDLDEKKENDQSFEIDGVPCVMDRSHAIYLSGMTIDWDGGLNSRGFVFKNPNAGTTCGCGTSFGV